MTARDFVKLGVKFSYKNGKLCYAAPSKQIGADIVQEVNRRKDIFVQKLALSHGTIPKLSEFQELRWGSCGLCGEPMEENRGGWCPLCVSARWRSLVETGKVKIQNVHTEPERVNDIAEAAKPSYPRAPWEK